MVPTVSPKSQGRITFSLTVRLLAALMVFSLTAALIPPAAAQNLPNWYNPTTKKGFEPNIPDFYQHQFWEKLPNGARAGWEKEGGYCRMVGVINALYSWKVYSNAPFGPPNNVPYRGLYNNAITQPNTWLNTSGDAIAVYAARGVLGDGDINTYLESLNHGDTAAKNGQPALRSTRFTVNGGKVFAQSADPAIGLEVVKTKKGGPDYNPFDFYADEMLKGRSTVLTVETPPVLAGQKYNGLWWTAPSFHTLTGVGFDRQTRDIYMADPDSNKGNKEINSDWTVARVTANRYGPVDAGLAPPIPNRTGPDAVPENYDRYYGTIRMNAAGDTIVASDANNGITNQGRYTGVLLKDIENIAPQIAAVKKVEKAPGPGFATSLALVGDVGDPVEEMLIYPVASIETSIVASIDLAGWQAEYLSLGALDPWDTARPRGGVRFFLSSQGSGDLFNPFDTAEGVFGTQTEFSGFDVFVRYADSDAWSFQSVGGPANPRIFQSAVGAPEPNTFALLGGMMLGILVMRRRH